MRKEVRWKSFYVSLLPREAAVNAELDVGNGFVICSERAGIGWD